MQQSGSSLVEVLVAVVILGILGAASLAAMATLISSGDRTRRAVSALTAVQSSADAVASTATPYVACSPESAYQARIASLGSAIPAGITVSVSQVEYFDGTQFVSTCPTTSPGDARRSQQITLTASGSRASRSFTFVKREP
jgi:type II secretory pathway pseudopilin PulG